MLKIGDFSRLAQVTVKTLRHYDRLRLLRPVYIDRFTGYRYYALEQLPRLNRILALKDLGFSLDQVSELLDNELPAQRLRDLFNQKQNDLHERIKTEESRLNRVAERLVQIEQEGCLPASEVLLKPLPQLQVAAIRATLYAKGDLSEERQWLKAVIASWAQQVGVNAAGQWLTCYHNSQYSETSQDIDMALVLQEPVDRLRKLKARKPVQVYTLPAIGTAASLLVAKDQELTTGITTLYSWSERNQYQPNGNLRAMELSDPHAQQAVSLTEVQLPVQSTRVYQDILLSNPYRKEKEMEPKIVDFPAKTVAGLPYFGKNENQEISQVWGQANQRFGELKHVKPGSNAYGVCLMVEGAAPGEFEYTCGLEITSENDLPEGMVIRHIPAGKYAVFTHVGALAGLKDTYNYIYQTWFPRSGNKPGPLDFELYDQDFKDFAPDSRFYIYVPIS
jgi:predicted transcriptional regulator YdeE/DNA-binding transcriptional MerR regulator